jgi:peptide/nickel transport system substrate-binding protein
LDRTSKAFVVTAIAAAIGGGSLWWYTSRSGGSRGEGAAAAAAAPTHGGEITASIRSEPASYNRYAPGGATAATAVLSLLVNAPLVRVNRATDDLEPWLAESWTQSDDGLTYTLRLREGVTFSDGEPFTARDVLFSFKAVYDARVKSSLAPTVLVAGKPLEVSAPDERTVVIRFPEPFAPGLRVLDNLPILPAHKLQTALDAGRLLDEWTPAKPLSDLAGLGPFVLTEHTSGQRLVFSRNRHYFRRDRDGAPLPYLDKLTLVVIPDQNTEALRLQAGETDLMTNGDIRPQDHAAFKRLSDQGALRFVDVGIGLDPDFLWFNLTPARAMQPSARWMQRREFRQAVSYAVDRQAIANTVYLGAAVPIFGPVSPGNVRWFSAAAPTYPFDAARAKSLLTSIGLTDRNGDGTLDDDRGAPVRFSVLAQAGHIRGRTAAVIQEQLRAVGVAVDLVSLDPQGLYQRWSSGDYDSIYYGFQASATDPALNADFWLPSGTGHAWNPSQTTPSVDWERRIDTLMHEQARAPDLAARQRAFAEVQRIMGEELPGIYFVAPRIAIATTTRVVNITPALQAPQLLWSADTLALARNTGTR